MWKRCAEGQNWSGSGCGGAAGTYNWDQAKLLTSTFAGKSDWRTPTEEELLSLVDYTNSSPAINTAIFPTTPDSVFWSTSAVANDSAYGWVVRFNLGDAASRAGFCLVTWGANSRQFFKAY